MIPPEKNAGSPAKTLGDKCAREPHANWKPHAWWRHPIDLLVESVRDRLVPGPRAPEQGNEEYRVDYVPGEATSYLFSDNSNWRGPIWFPINFLIVEALERYHLFLGEGFKVECPIGSGKMLTLKEVAQELSRRLGGIFLPDENGMRSCHGGITKYETDPHWRDLVLFHEYFHGETGRSCGASDQTGWTALAVKLLENTIEHPDRSKTIDRDSESEASEVRGETGEERERDASRPVVTV